MILTWPRCRHSWERAFAALHAASPALLFGVRTVAAVGFALFIAFELELDRAYWAGATAAIVCQPVLGSALRKALFRMAGTLAGAVAAVLLFDCFPQDRVGFTLGFAAWCAMCGFIASRLQFFAAYGAALAGYTAAIIVGDVIDDPGSVFAVALARVTAIELGIVVATVVLVTTEFGGSSDRLARTLEAMAGQAATSLLAALAPADRRAEPAEPRAFLLRLAAMAQLIDQVTGEATFRRLDPGGVRAAQDALFACCAETQQLWTQGGGSPPVGPAPTPVWEALPPRLREGASVPVPAWLLADVRAAADTLSNFGGREPTTQPVAVCAARGFTAIAVALEAAVWLTGPERAPAPRMVSAHFVPTDPLPALVDAARAYGSVLAAVVLWIATRWPNGPGAITWTVIPILLMSPQQERAHDAALSFTIGTLLAAGAAAFTDFVLLPQMQTFVGLVGLLALVLGPLAALSTRPRAAALVGPALFNFVPLVAPANRMSFDPSLFYNNAMSIVIGCAMAAIALRVLPPVPVPIRARRIVASATADCAAIAADHWRPTGPQWRDRMRRRVTALPATADPRCFLELLALYHAGGEVLRARSGPCPVVGPETEACACS